MPAASRSMLARAAKVAGFGLPGARARAGDRRQAELDPHGAAPPARRLLERRQHDVAAHELPAGEAYVGDPLGRLGRPRFRPAGRRRGP